MLLAAGTVASAEDPAKDPDVDMNFVHSATPEALRETNKRIAEIGKKVQEILSEQTLRTLVGMSPLLRQIVCRVPFQKFEVSALARALGLPEPTVFEGVQLLDRLGIAALKDAYEGRVIVPKSPRSNEMMRRWAYDWCDSDDKCGVRR